MQIGTTAAIKLIQKIENKEPNKQDITFIPVKLVHRETTKK